MNKKSWIIIAIIVTLLIGAGIFFYIRNSPPIPNGSNYKAGKTSTNSTSNQKEENNEQKNENQESKKNPEEQESQENQKNIERQGENPESSTDINTKDEATQGVTESENNPAPTIEEQIATFSTKIYTKDSARQNNISITCNTLNGSIVKNGSTFSFCNTVGASSTSKGYQKADIFDKNGNKKKGLGGRKLSN